MELTCRGIENLSIGTNYGGKLYDLKIDVNFNSSSVFMASFVSENGTYSISEADLNSETPTTLSIAGSSFLIFPVNYKKQSSPSGNLLMVKFVDASHIYLDKFNVTLKTFTESARFLPVIPVEINEDSSGSVEMGKYTPSELQEVMEEKIPMSSRVKTLLKSFKRIEGPEDDEGLKEVTGLYLDSMGTLRDVLSNLGGQIGYTFFWDWSVGGVGELDVVSWTATDDAKTFAGRMKADHGPYISNYEESYSIEDNYASSDFIYDTSTYKVEKQTGRLTSRKRIGYTVLDIIVDDFWIKPSWEREYFTEEELRSNDWFKMCAAALVSEEFFRDYVYWNIAAEAGERLLPLRSMKDEKIKETYNGWLHTYKPENRNKMIPECLSNFYVAGLIAYRKEDYTLQDEIVYMRGLGGYSRAEAMEHLKGRNGQCKKINDAFGTKDNPFWFIAIRGVDVNPDAKSQTERADLGEEDSSSVGAKPVGNAFESVLKKLYDTCYKFGENFQRYYVSAKVKRQVGFKDTYDLLKVKKKIKESYDIPYEWAYQYADAGDQASFLKSLIDYRKQPIFTETWKAENQNQKPAVAEFIAGPKAWTLSNGASEISENITEVAESKLEGILWIDISKNRKFAPTNDVKRIDVNIEQGNTITDSINLRGYKAYAVNANSNIESIMDYAIKLFGVDAEGKSLTPFFHKTHTRVLDIESMPMSSFDWRGICKSQDQFHPKAMSNIFSISKVPEVGEEYKFNMEKWLDILTQYKWPNAEQMKANVSYNFTIEKLVPVMSNWLNVGVESYSLSYSGSSGVTTNITIGSRKKQRQAMENQERLMRVAIGSGIGLTKVYTPKPSAARGSIKYGMKAFS